MTPNLTDEQKKEILELKANMNLNLDLNSQEVLDWNRFNLLNGKINYYWLLGFTEAITMLQVLLV